MTNKTLAALVVAIAMAASAAIPSSHAQSIRRDGSSGPSTAPFGAPWIQRVVHELRTSHPDHLRKLSALDVRAALSYAADPAVLLPGAMSSRTLERGDIVTLDQSGINAMARQMPEVVYDGEGNAQYNYSNWLTEEIFSIDRSPSGAPMSITLTYMDYVFDELGQPTDEMIEKREISELEYDEQNRLFRISYKRAMDGTTKLDYVTTLTFDAEGRVIAIQSEETDEETGNPYIDVTYIDYSNGYGLANYSGAGEFAQIKFFEGDTLMVEFEVSYEEEGVTYEVRFREMFPSLSTIHDYLTYEELNLYWGIPYVMEVFVSELGQFVPLERTRVLPGQRGETPILKIVDQELIDFPNEWADVNWFSFDLDGDGLPIFAEKWEEDFWDYEPGDYYWSRKDLINPAPEFLRFVSLEEGQDIIPASIGLMQNYPNPFNPSTRIAFILPASGQVRLEVFDVMGRNVATLLDGRTLAAGRHEVDFDAAALSSGIYFYRLAVSGPSAAYVSTATITRSMMLQK